MVRAAPLVVLLLAGCSNEPQLDNGTMAAADARQALDEIRNLDDRLTNVETQQNRIDTELQDAEATVADHDQKLDRVRQKADQSEADLIEVKDKLRM